MSEEEAFVQACSQGDMDTFHRLIRYKDTLICLIDRQVNKDTFHRLIRYKDNEEDNGLMRYKITPQTIDFKD